MASKFQYENIEFARIDNYDEIRKKIQQERATYQTGVATVEIPKEIKEPSEAIRHAEDILEKCSILLSFAHNHDVFFHSYSCYDNSGKCVLESWRSIRVGGPTGGGLNIYSHGFAEFLAIGMPLILDKNFTEKTEIYRALLWYNEAVTREPKVVDLEIPILWAVLEILANCHAKSKPKDFFLPNETWRLLIEKIESAIASVELPEDKRYRLYGYLGNLRKGSIVDKVNYLLDEYGFSQYKSEIPIFYDMRNKFHGGVLDYNAHPSPIDTMLKLQKLLVKLILKILNFYDKKDFIHSSILKEDLLARA